jgi:hypothetical protein
MEPTFDQNASLKLIREMIETSKTNYKENVIFFLLWGWLGMAASIIQFILLKINYPQDWLPWPVLMSAGAIVSVIIGIRIGKRTTVWSYISKMMVYLWYGFFVTVVILIVFANLGKMPWHAAQPMIVALYGLGTFVSGGALKFKPLIWGGIFSWICAIIAFIVPYEYGLLVIAASILVAYLIPGYILKNKNRTK